MTKIKLPFLQLITLSFVVTLALVSFRSGSTQVQAQPAKPEISTAKRPNLPTLSQQRPLVSSRVQVRFVPPPAPDRGAPGQRQGAASRCVRDSCPPVDTPLTALVPEYNNLENNQSVWGLTVDSHPTFWVYVPYPLTPDRPVEFRLQDEEGRDNENYVHKTTFRVQTEPGVVSFRLPSTVPPLEIGKRYFWSFIIQHKPQDSSANQKNSSANNFVTGWIERIAPNTDLMKQLKPATPRERIAIYAANGIWYDAVTNLAELRRDAPKDGILTNEWADLMQAVDLRDITSKPIVQCCTLDK